MASVRRRLIRTCGRGQPAANGVAEASSRPAEAAGFPFDSFEGKLPGTVFLSSRSQKLKNANSRAHHTSYGSRIAASNLLYKVLLLNRICTE